MVTNVRLYSIRLPSKIKAGRVRSWSVVLPRVNCIAHGLCRDVPPARREGLLPERVELVLLRRQRVRQSVTKIDNFCVILRVLFAVRNSQDG
jgi:hypothetical protein